MGGKGENFNGTFFASRVFLCYVKGIVFELVLMNTSYLSDTQAPLLKGSRGSYSPGNACLYRRAEFLEVYERIPGSVASRTQRYLQWVVMCNA